MSNIVPIRRHRPSIAASLGMLVVGPVLAVAIMGTLALVVVWYEIAGLFSEGEQ